jgi:hypothetical protein
MYNEGMLKRVFLFVCLALIFLWAKNHGLTRAVFIGEQTQGYFGKSVVFGGDIFGNGQKSLWFGAPQVPSGNRGRIYRYTGVSLPVSTTNVSTLPKITESMASFQIGKRLLSGVDMDRDGLADTFLGIPDDDKIALFLGEDAAEWGTSITIASANVLWRSPSVLIQQLDKNGESPPFLSAAGDLNGDGFPDLAIGALGTSNVYVVLGKTSFNASINLDLPTTPNITAIVNKTGSEKIGYGVAIIPDINGDGLDELAISTYQPNAETGNQVYLFYGKKDGFLSLMSSGIKINTSAADAVFQSASSGTDGFGETIIGLGDVDGDGYGDFAIGAPATDSRRGGVYIYYGGAGKPYSGTVSASSILFKGETANALFGFHAVDHADMNGDGYQDIIVGEYLGNSLKGKVYIFYGSSTRFSGQTLASQASLSLAGATVGDGFGYAVAYGGDWNNDGQDDVAIGIPGYDSNRGQSALFSNSSISSANLSTGTPVLSFYSDAALSQSLTQATANQLVYIKLTATDPQPSTRNTAFIAASSGRVPASLTLKLVETGVGTGIFKGYFRPVSTRSQKEINQVGVSVNASVTFAGASVLGTLTMVNAVPSLSAATAVQTTTGNSTLVRIDYTVYDAEEDLGSFNQSSTQVQFLDAQSVWQNASVTGSIQALTTLALGKTHTTGAQPLYWKAGADGFTNGTTKLRLKVFDGTVYSRTITTNTFIVTNAAPSTPVIFAIPTKNSYSISVSGNADAGTRVSIYTAATNGSSKLLATSVTANSLGVFTASSITVSTTRNRITAISRTSLGFLSEESAARLVSFSITSQSFTDSGLGAEIVASVNAFPNDRTLVFSKIATSSLTVAAPTYYRFVQAFSVGLQGQSSVTLNTPTTITITLPTALSSTRNAAVRYLDTTSNTWKTTGITIKKITATSVTFTTTHFTQFVILNTTDVNDPVINTPKINDAFVVEGGYYSNTPLITVTMQDTESGLSAWTIQLKNTLTGVTATQNSASGLNTTQNTTVTLRQTTALADGTYAILITASDNSIHTTNTYTTFTIGTTAFNLECIAGPNPYNPDRGSLTVGYNLSQDADALTFYIVNPRGDLLWRYYALGSEKNVGYHSLLWNGKWGSQTLSNGPYFLFALAKKGGVTKKVLFRLAVLR